MNSFLKTSVIIPTRGRDQCLRVVLDDLSRQSNTEFDVWVIDQNQNKLSNLHIHLPQRTLYHESMEPKGSHAGRNYAIFRTRSPLCIFVDDDVRLPENFIKRHIEKHSTLESEVAVVCGRVVQPKDGFSEEYIQQHSKLARYDRIWGRVLGNFIGMGEGPIDHIHECNFSAKTAVLKEVGGFNEGFLGNAYYEGADLGLRIQSSGHVLWYDGSISLTHLQEGSGGNRENDKARHTFWMMKNLRKLNQTHLKKTHLPLFFAYGLAYVCAKALRNRSGRIAIEGLKGLFSMGSRP